MVINSLEDTGVMGRAGSGLTVQISIKSDINKGDKICMITDETYCLINMYIH